MVKKKQQTYESEKLDNELEKELKKLKTKSFKSLIDQIETEYQLAWWYLKPKIDEWQTRLKLYNNQKRDKTAIGDPLLFTIHQSVLASLYSDRLLITFEPREEGDEEVAENLTQMAEFDYWQMLTPIIDYIWDWDATFFGRGLLLMQDFNRDKLVPVMENIDPLSFLRDPHAVSVNGDVKGNKALRFCGWEVRMTKRQMEENKFFNLDKLKAADNETNSLVDSAIRARQEAQGLSNTGKMFELKGENKEYRLLRWYTRYGGKRVMVYLANDRKEVVKYVELPYDRWPIIDRPIYPISHDWDGVSIPDLIEDKQRARAVIQNLGLKAVRAGVYPRYLYDSNRIKNRHDLDIEFNKHIPVNGRVDDGVIRPVETAGIKAEVKFILELLDTAAERATATPEMQQGMLSQEKRTATEIEKMDAKVGRRYSLAARIWGWSEHARWLQWYKLYKRYFEDGIDEKILRLNGALGYEWRRLERSNIITTGEDPDIKIESRAVIEANQLMELQKYQNFINLAITHPAANKLFALRELGKKSGLSQQIIDNILPPTTDEILAEEENKILKNNKPVPIRLTDDDRMHILIHQKLSDDIPTKEAHINAHKKAILIKKQLGIEPNVQAQQEQEQPSEEVAAKQSAPIKPNNLKQTNV